MDPLASRPAPPLAGQAPPQPRPAARPPAPPPRLRLAAPPSVRFAALVLYLVGLGLLLLAASAALAAAGLGRLPQAPGLSLAGHDIVATSGYVAAGVLCVAATMAIAVGRRLNRRRRRARVLAVTFAVCLVAATIYQGLHGSNANVLAGLVAPVLYVALLNTRAAREWFRTGSY